MLAFEIDAGKIDMGKIDLKWNNRKGCEKIDYFRRWLLP
jgi:hypothetical protein